MRLADLPSTRVIDGRRQTRRPVGTPPTEVEAYRALLDEMGAAPPADAPITLPEIK